MFSEIENRLRRARLELDPPSRDAEERALQAALAELSLSASRPARAPDPSNRSLRLPRRRFAFSAAALLLVIAGIVAWVSLTGSSSSPSLIVGGPGNQTERFPSDTLTDWVSYADQVSVVSVVSEDPDPEDLARGEGYVGRTVILNIEETLWRREGAPSLDGPSVPIRTLGWGLQDDELHPYAVWGSPRMEVGQRYVVALVRAPRNGVEWTGLATDSTLPLRGDVISTEGVVGERPSFVLKKVAGMSTDEFAAALARTSPDPLAVKYGDLDPEERVKRVFRERGLTD